MENKILVKMLERLFAGLVSGPSMNCRPHASRQRIDVTQLGRLRDIAPEQAIQELFGAAAAVKITARVPPPPCMPPGRTQGRTSQSAARDDEADGETETALSDADRLALEAWRDQQAVLSKLRIIAEEARTYELDTGVHALHLGFPLLSLPPGTAGAGGGSGGRVVARRLLAPIAFVPITVTVRSAAHPQVVIECRGDEIDRAMPNSALLAWLERHTGKPTGELFHDEAGSDPWREIHSIVRHVTTVLELPAVDLSAEAPFRLNAAPRADESTEPAIITAAVLGLFPQNNQGLLRDMQAMAAGESLDGPVQSFIDVSVTLDVPADPSYAHDAWSGERQQRPIAGERHVTASDPCQSRAVRLARECRGLVIHGPPGTGKSQTITNIIGDHLARGERVLMVCDKRTALDVVANRLAHLGLGSLCALVHDPQRDQRDLYRNVREQLESLSDAAAAGAPLRELDRTDAELERLHEELSTAWKRLHEPDGARGGSFHELAGAWLATRPDTAESALEVHDVRMADLAAHEHDVQDIVERAARVDFAQNPWAGCAAMELHEFLSRPMQQLREAMQRCLVAARVADESWHVSIPPCADPAIVPLAEQAESRQRLADALEQVARDVPATLRDRWSAQNENTVRRTARKLEELRPYADTLADPLDSELELISRAQPIDLAVLQRQMAELNAYLATARHWYAFVFVRRRRRAAAVLERYGLPLDIASAERLRRFLVACKARAMLAALHHELSGSPSDAAARVADEQLGASYRQAALVVQLRLAVSDSRSLSGMGERVARALADDSACTVLLDGLRRSARRVQVIQALDRSIEATGLVASSWRTKLCAELAMGGKAVAAVEPLDDQVDSLEDVLRIRRGLASLPGGLRSAVEEIVNKSLDSRRAIDALRHGVLACEIADWLRASPPLQRIDAQRMRSSMERYRALDAQRQTLVRDAVLDRWRARQQERLLVGTRTRLNSVAADLRRRLTMRGERAMRLRQVIAVGQGIDGGDPLFDLRPVWMASPETVAQVFPRTAMFDVVVFDEASQCRLEEALPVLTRARRVVIAGDPKQLPPTRFFESAIATSDSDEAETEQELFEVHQGEIEDLLGAALSIDIPQSYLDVHYRSRNADLIQFSNVQFYSARLQPIPAHPNHRARFAPITLHRAGGVYDRRMNRAEAETVVRIVADLLQRAEPPSIGVACFNITQRDLIAELLEERAEADPEFGRRLAESRVRRGASSFEGLFVKNLENVQGDERDHVIISTTYGPDSKGRFYRRFGPVGRAGGGRRLNVLVTRARHEVHLVTSIPPAAYRGLPAVPAGQFASGAWLLFAYLAYAEFLAEAYENANRDVQGGGAATEPVVAVQAGAATSEFAEAMARQLTARHRLGSDVNWGSDGFCVDIAIHDMRRRNERTLGVLCDGSRFRQAEDPVEWDIFRTSILEQQGWKLHRIWTPQYVRDPAGVMAAVAEQAYVELTGTPNQGTTRA